MTNRKRRRNGKKVSNFICGMSSPTWPFHPCGGPLKRRPQAEAVALLIECLPNMLGVLDSTPNLAAHK